MEDKIGIITFHRSYNCGSMLQTLALQTVLTKMGRKCEIIDFSNDGQRRVYSVYDQKRSMKSLVKNAILFSKHNRIEENNKCYEAFISNHFSLSKNSFTTATQLSDDHYSIVVAGSDQIWNITIEDGDEAYFLPWVSNAKKVAYAPSFGAKNILDNTSNPAYYRDLLCSFDCLSIRENNGKRWIRDLTGLDVPVVLDPTLLLEAEDYERFVATGIALPENYIFYYAPQYNKASNEFVRSLSEKYGLPVIAFNTKTFYLKGMQFSGFTLPVYEDPSMYLLLMKNASMVVTTSFHGTVFSNMYNKCFWTLNNGAMFGDDDRVATLTALLGMNDRVIVPEFDQSFDYLEMPDYAASAKALYAAKETSLEYLRNAIS